MTKQVKPKELELGKNNSEIELINKVVGDCNDLLQELSKDFVLCQNIRITYFNDNGLGKLEFDELTDKKSFDDIVSKLRSKIVKDKPEVEKL